MSSVSQESWVTYVNDDGSVGTALLLILSLRRTMTNRKILALLGPSVSKQSWKRLLSCADDIIKIPEGVECGIQDMDTFAKIYCWCLPFLRKCIFLDANSLVLENCDELFDHDGIAAAGDRDGTGRIDSSILVLRPSVDIYDLIMDSLSNQRPCSTGDMGQVFETILAQNFQILRLPKIEWWENLFSSNGRKESEPLGPGILLAVPQFPGLIKLHFHLDIFQNGVVKLRKILYLEVNGVINGVQKPDTCLPLGGYINEPIAIVGMSFRLPGANNVEEFWDLMMNKQDAVISVPSDRWTTAQSCVVTEEGRKITAGFLNCPVDEFDKMFFGISANEILSTDPQQRLLLEIAWEAFENGAIDPTPLKGSRMGIFCGVWRNDYKELMIENGVRPPIIRSYLGNSFGTTAGRLAHFFGATGSNISTDSGCSSSMISVGLACRSLRSGDSNLALACGVNLLLRPFSIEEFAPLIAPDGHCKTFDVNADGYARAEGCVVLVLKRLSDAISEGDIIHGLIRGYGESQEGVSSSIGTPTVQCEAMAMKLALEDSNVHPSQISYVETHGTGTALGDRIEMQALSNVYSKDRLKPLFVGSVKTNIGHTEALSGITGIVKTVLSLKNQIIPPLRELLSLSPLIDLKAIPAIIPTDPVEWESHNGEPRLAAVSSFGITGTDTHLILEEPPKFYKINNGLSQTFVPPLNLVTISAKSERALEELLTKYKSYFKNNSLNLTDIAYTAGIGRAHFNHRISITGSNSSDIIRKMENSSFERSDGSLDGNMPKITFLFTGQGSQYKYMGKALFQASPVFRTSFIKCDTKLEALCSISIRESLWEDNIPLNKESLHTQASIFCIEYSLFKLWESWGIKPDCVLGHSLGEFAAATAAGIISLEDALQLLATRCGLIDKIDKGNMLAVNLDETNTTKMISTFQNENLGLWLDIAAINSLDQTIVSGRPEAIAKFAKYSEAKTNLLNAAYAFHSRDMDSILGEYRQIADSLTYNNPSCQYISGLEGTTLKGKMNGDYWLRHSRESVKFLQASREVYSTGSRVFIEIGPLPILLSLLSRNIPDIHQPLILLPSIKPNSEWKTMLDALAKLYVVGCDINWKGFYQFYPKQKISLPFYPFQRKKYWFDPKPIIKSCPDENKIHPSLGTILECANNQTIFKNIITLETLPYISDHSLGEHAIFPAATYIEMSLSAGFLSNPSEDLALKSGHSELPLKIEDILIKSPLKLSEDSVYELQTIVSRNESNLFASQVSIFSRVNGEPNFISHTEAKFRFGKQNLDDLSLAKLDDIKGQITNPMSSPGFYTHLRNIGYNFGPKFQSLQQIWKCKEGYLAEISTIPDTRNGYLSHPIIIDAMLQSCIITDSPMDSLLVPVLIERLIFFKKPVIGSNLHYIYVSDSNDKSVSLYDGDGSILAFLNGVQLVQTSLHCLTKSMEVQKSLSPMFKEEWKPSSLTLVDFGHSVLEDISEDIIAKVKTHVSVDTAEQKNLNKLGRVVALGVMKSFRQMGWNPNVGDELNLLKEMEEMHIVKRSHLITRRFFEILVEDGYLTQSSDRDVFTVKQTIPSMEDLNTEISDGISTLQGLEKELQLSVLFLEKLNPILSGECPPLEILFPKSDAKISAEIFYNEAQTYLKSSALFSQCIESLVSNRIKKSGTSRQFKILEIGAGTGSATKTILPILEASGINYLYEFTDISASFFIKARDTFKSYSKSMDFRTLNIEDDPLAQGFTPHEFDIIIATNVLHATINLTQTCTTARLLIKKFGLICIMETFIPQRHLDLAFGQLDGCWRFKDTQLRKAHCLISESGWKTLLSQVGFSSTMSHSVCGGSLGVVIGEASDSHPPYVSPSIIPKIWIVFSDQSELCLKLIYQIQVSGRTVVVLKQNNYFGRDDQLSFSIRSDSKLDIESFFAAVRSDFPSGEIEGVIYLWARIEQPLKAEILIEPYLYLLQTLQTLSCPKLRLLLITEGLIYFSDQEPRNPKAAALLGMTRSFRTETPWMICKSIDLDPNPEFNCVDNIISELWNQDPEPLLAFRDGIRHTPKLIPTQFYQMFNPLPLPDTGHFSLLLPKSKSIADLKFGPSFPPNLQDDQIEVTIKTVGHNFKDLLNVLKPTDEFQNSNCVGVDFSGVVTAIGPKVSGKKVGDTVYGFDTNSLQQGRKETLKSIICISENDAFLLPNHMTCAEGSTLPVVFATAYHCLVQVANLSQGEWILIHTAASGVGLVAIQIAKQLGANIVATAGSRRKRSYLRSIGITNVFNSRTLDFEKGVQTVTNGLGVDVILNSITGPGFVKACLKVGAKNARFVEMSKVNIWTSDQVGNLRPDIVYSTVDLSAMDLFDWRFLMNVLNQYIISKRIKPLPFTQFDIVNIRNALSQIEKGSHIGKIVCKLPEIQYSIGISRSITFNLFNDRSTYLITGGLRGVGLEITKWMSKLGAKYCVLCSRSKPSNIASDTITQLRNSGVTILVTQTDIGNINECVKLFDHMKKSGLPPLRGVMHLAGCISDALIGNQTLETFQIALHPKIHGSWNLHLLTKDYNLEHFVMFSSTSSVMGQKGQSNHAAANSYMDTLAHYRNSLGLPGTSINWGQWGETGVAAGIPIKGITPMSTICGTSALEHILKSHVTQATVCDGDVSKWKSMFPWAATYFGDVRTETHTLRTVAKSELDFTNFYPQLQNVLEADERKGIIQRYISQILSSILRLEDDEILHKNQHFKDLGVDSLMLIELRNYVQRLIGPDAAISSNDLADCNTVELFTNKVFQTIYSDKVDHQVVEDERNRLIHEDSILWDHIQGHGKSYCKTQDIKTILLTGVTGNLAPYILELLTKRDQIQTIYCLVRETTIEKCKAKLYNHLKRIDLLDRIDMRKIKIIKGDISEPLLGIKPDLYQELALGIDAVINCAVRSSHLDEYRKVSNTLDNIRSVNVTGTQRILEFASTQKLKWVYHSSSLSAALDGGHDGKMPESFPAPDEFDNGPNFGYAISKFVAERLVSAAVDRGIPCKVFRFPVICGDSRSGRQSVQSSHFLLRYLTYLKLGVIPNCDVPLQLVPVDFCASISLQVVFCEESSCGVYNVLNPHNQSEKDIAIISQELGFPIAIVEYEEFVNRVIQDGNRSLLYHVLEFYTDEDRYMKWMDKMTAFKMWMQNPKTFYCSGKVNKIIPDIQSILENPLDILRRDIRYAIEVEKIIL